MRVWESQESGKSITPGRKATRQAIERPLNDIVK